MRTEKAGAVHCLGGKVWKMRHMSSAKAGLGHALNIRFSQSWHFAGYLNNRYCHNWHVILFFALKDAMWWQGKPCLETIYLHGSQKKSLCRLQRTPPTVENMAVCFTVLFLVFS